MIKLIIISIVFFSSTTCVTSQQLTFKIDSLSQDYKTSLIDEEKKASPEISLTASHFSSDVKPTPKTQSSRYLFSESAYGLKEGQHMYQNILGVLNSYSYGFSDNFTFNFSTELANIIAGRFPIVLLSPKYTFGSEQSNVRYGLGVNYAFSISDDNEAIGSVYGLMTIGKPYNNITIGLGYLYDTDDGFDDRPYFQLSTSLLLSEKYIFLVDANFAIDGELQGIISPTLRYTKGNATFDLSVTITSEDEAEVIPVAGVSFLF
ncbi:MAG: hypothetical protein HKN51_17540 [Saprospiraceae bacterium]|nr:hypothetical protein [Saprospiraceae bacterium]